MGGIGGMITAMVETFATDTAGIFRIVNKATAGGSSLTKTYPDTADATVGVFVTTPSMMDLRNLSDDAKATHKLIFADKALDLKRRDHVVVNSITYEVESVPPPSTPTPYLAAFAFVIQTGRGDE